MGKPDAAPKYEETPKQKEISAKYHLDQITDPEKRLQIIAYFEEREEALKHLTSARLSSFRSIVEKNADKSADTIITEMINKAFEDYLEIDCRSKYFKQFGDVTLEKSINVEFWGTEGSLEDLEDAPSFREARKRTMSFIMAQLSSIQKAKGLINPEYMDKYAEWVIRKYVDHMDSDVNAYVSLSDVDDNLQPLLITHTFEEFIRYGGSRISDEELFSKLSGTEAKRFLAVFAKTKAELAKINPKTEGLHKKLQDYFKDESQAIRDGIMSSGKDRKSFVKKSENLAIAFSDGMKISVLRSTIEAKIKSLKDAVEKSGLDAKSLKPYEALLEKTDGNIDSFITSKDKKDFGLEDLNEEKTKLDKDIAKAQVAAAKKTEKTKTDKEKEEGKAKVEKEEPSPIKDPEAWFKWQLEKNPIMYLILTFLGGEKAISKVTGMLKKWKGKGDKMKRKIERKTPHFKKYQKFLKEDFGFTSAESDILAWVDIKDVVGASSEAPAKVNKDRFSALQSSLKQNGADINTEGDVLNFVKEKQKNWKKESVAPASEDSADEGDEDSASKDDDGEKDKPTS